VSVVVVGQQARSDDDDHDERGERKKEEETERERERVDGCSKRFDSFFNWNDHSNTLHNDKYNIP
jgi:hypothetical protein